jgi:two-component system sensor histidine kinase DesK
MFASFRGSVWILQLTREEATTAAIKADLAVAQERLRFSRDLHDIFGRTLTAVAVKSDLAAELADHGRAEQAAAEMRAVNELAQQAITEVRGVVSAMRTPELTTELSGARALLTSSGTQVRIVGDAADARYPDVMGWIVREAVTNIIRHSQATWCEIFVEPCSLRVVNDGADVPARDSRLDHAGSGLRGLEDRVRHTGGHLSVESAGGIFTLRAHWEE